jgi:hypothetical protein
MLQGYNAGNSYDIFWDNLRDTRATVSAQGANVSATAGAPFSGTVATFTTDQLESAKAFTAVITWGDGSTSNGDITFNNGIYTVSGSHTYAAAASYALSVQISSPTTDLATANAIATVANPPVGPGMTGDLSFWQDPTKGQALIKSFTPNPGSKTLGQWLATTLPNLYGPSTSHDMTNWNNNKVANYLQLPLDGWEAQVLATALNVYATTSSLGGNAGLTYHFTVSDTGLGARSYSVGMDGAAFGVANNTTMTVNDLLSYVNSKASKGVAYSGDTTLQGEAADLFASLNQAGSSGIG